MHQHKKAFLPSSSNRSDKWPIVLWLVLLSGTLSFLPFCLDQTLAPRFFFLSAALLVSIVLVWKDLRESTGMRWHIFDLLLLGWYGLNLMSVSWSLSWSEGVFYAQKPLLLFGVYFILRYALYRDEGMVLKALKQITLLLTLCVCTILFFQIGLAASKNGLDNETLYAYASGASGNKSLAAEFLFFLLVFNLMFVVPAEDLVRKPAIMVAIFVVLCILIVVLQVRTAILAMSAGLGAYCLLRVIAEPGFRKPFLQTILPKGLLALGLLLGLLAWKGKGSSMAERLNPLNYLESATANERRFVWHKTDLLNAEHYWLGVGNGSWKFWMPSKNIGGGYRLAEGNVVFTRAHNDYLEIRAEMGMVGALWFCALFGVAFFMAFYCTGDFSRRNAKGDAAMPPEQASAAEAAGTALAATTGLLGYCIVQYFDFPRERIEFQVVLGLLFAVLVHKSKDLCAKFSQKTAPILKALPFVLMIGLAFNLVIGWERISGETHNIRLLDAQAKGDWRRVVAEAQKAENVFYKYTDAAIPLAWHEGVGWFQLGQYDKSAFAFERAYGLNPWSFQVINNYASSLVKLKRYSEAIPLFEKALSINPRYDEGKFNLSFVYFQMNDFALSEKWLSLVDTIANPGNDNDREKNKATLKRLSEFRKVVEEKQK